MIPLYKETIETPIGALIVLTDTDGFLRFLDWDDHEDRLMRLVKHYHGTAVTLTQQNNQSGIAKQLIAYYKGDKTALDSIRVKTMGTAFQEKVWHTLRGIKYGQTISYGGLAALMDSPKAVRAVANANANNPISIVVPCHRVIGSDGSLTGYAGGVHRKEWLLRHEGALLSQKTVHA